MRLKLWSLAAATLLAVLGTGCGNSPNGPTSVAFSGSAVIPHEGFRDWISYSDQVSVVTVVSEGELPVDSAVLERGEGSIGRRVTIRIDETIWSVAERPALEGEHEMTTLGWALTKGRKVPFTGQLQVGARYLLPLATIDGQLANASGASAIRLEQGRLAPDVWTDGWTKGLAGQDLGSVAETLRTQQPDPRAAALAHLEGGARARAVKEASRR